MAELLYDLLKPDLGPNAPATPDAATVQYLEYINTRSLSDLVDVEPQRLAQIQHANLLAFQALSKKSVKPIISSAAQHASLSTTLPALASCTAELRRAIPKLDDQAVNFSTTFSKSVENEALQRRKKALLLSRNAERLVDILELPTLLNSVISSSPPNYPAALDLNSHIRRLHALYPTSPLIISIRRQADEAMHTMAANLIRSLQAPGLKLAASLRTIGWLRRVLPDLGAASTGTTDLGSASQQGNLGAIFLVCRLATLMKMLEALEPLRDLADQERHRQKSLGSGNAWSGGQQTERFLKRYIEIFREQSFAMVSMFKSMFPDGPVDKASASHKDPLGPLPSALATFPLHLVDLLLETLRMYMPTVKDQASRDSLLTQVLYCAGSLGRLGGDFGSLLADMDLGGEADDEWEEVVRRHRSLAGRLETVVGNRERVAAA